MIDIFSRCGNAVLISRRSLVFLSALGALSVVASSGTAQADQTTAPPKPKIAVKQAEAAAVRKIGGKVVSSKYEFEDGHWQYAVVVNDKKGQMYEVEVNSTTGKVTDTEKTSAAEEAREEAADKKAAMSKTTLKSSKEDKEDKND